MKFSSQWEPLIRHIAVNHFENDSEPWIHQITQYEIQRFVNVVPVSVLNFAAFVANTLNKLKNHMEIMNKRPDDEIIGIIAPKTGAFITQYCANGKEEKYFYELVKGLYKLLVDGEVCVIGDPASEGVFEYSIAISGISLCKEWLCAFEPWVYKKNGFQRAKPILPWALRDWFKTHNAALADISKNSKIGIKAMVTAGRILNNKEIVDAENSYMEKLMSDSLAQTFILMDCANNGSAEYPELARAFRQREKIILESMVNKGIHHEPPSNVPRQEDIAPMSYTDWQVANSQTMERMDNPYFVDWDKILSHANNNLPLLPLDEVGDDSGPNDDLFGDHDHKNKKKRVNDL